MSQWTEEDTKLILQEIIVMVNTDEEFRKLYLENSSKEIKQMVEKEIAMI